jgi:hypothetical protein
MSPYFYDNGPDPCVKQGEHQDLEQVSSVSELIRILGDFLAGLGENDLKICTPEELIYEPDVQKLLKGQRKVYDPNRGILTVIGMARPLHDAIQRIAYRFLNRATHESLTVEESDALQISNAGFLLTRREEDANAFPRKKAGAWMKYPDACFLFEDPETHQTTPMVVFEAGFSEKYPDLIADARDWLLYTRGKVRLVILLEIQEDLSLKRAYQKTKQSKERVKNLLVKYANDKGKEHLDMGEEHFGKENSDLTPPSDTDLYNSIEDQVVSEDWVGPITAYLEFWEAGPKGPCQRGNRVVSHLGPIDTSPNAPADFISYLYTSMTNLVLIVACVT